MNPEDNEVSTELFILNDAQLRAPLREIYTIKYFFLLTTTIIVINIEITTLLSIDIDDQNTENQNIYMRSFIAILAMIIPFIINCNSQFFGHRRLFLISYSFTIGFYVISFIKIFNQNLIVFLLGGIFQQLIFTQIMLQIWGSWPNQFIRVITEFIMLSQIILFLIYTLSIWIKNFDQYFLFALIIINIILCNIDKSINDFRSPETDSVVKDFFRLIFNKKQIIIQNKPFIFTLLIGTSLWLTIFLEYFFLIIFLFNLEFDYYLNEYDPTNNNIYMDEKVIMIAAIVYIVVLYKLKNIRYQSTLIIALSLIVLLLISLFIVVTVVTVATMNGPTWLNYKYSSLIMFYILLLIFTILLIHIIPQYQKILLNIGIRNLDFASSYQQLSLGLFNILIIFLKFQTLIQLILTLMGIIVFLSFIFYYLMGFSLYFINSNRSYVEENEFQIEID